MTMASSPSSALSRRRPMSDIFTMNFGFLGIQFGWGLQMANMSAIYEKLGAQPDEIPLLWLAAPMTGLIVQPVVGALSDRTWTRLGRRRPYFLTGAILASLALFAMPHSPALWVAATLLWVLDSSINVSMEPFRAFVADRLDDEQRPLGFVMQSFFSSVLAPRWLTFFPTSCANGWTSPGAPPMACHWQRSTPSSLVRRRFWARYLSRY